MKKIISFITVVFIMILLTACLKNSTGQSPEIADAVISDDLLSTDSTKDSAQLSESGTDSESYERHSVFKTHEINIEGFEIIEVEEQPITGEAFDSLGSKKIAALDNNLIVADELSEKIVLYQYDLDTLSQEKILELPANCAIGFTDNFILVIRETQVDYYDVRLEKQKTVEIEEISNFRSYNNSYRCAIVINDTHIAYFAHDRSVYIMNLDNGEEKQINIKADGEIFQGLFHGIYTTDDPNHIIINGSLYEDGEDPSIVDASKSVIMVVDISQGIVVDYVYESELVQSRSLISPNTETIITFTAENVNKVFDYKKWVEETGLIVMQNTYISNNYAIYEQSIPYEIIDFSKQKIYRFFDKAYRNIIASYVNGNTTYFLLTGLDTNKKTYLVKI